MSTSPQNDRQQAIRTLRMELRDDLLRVADAAPHYFAGYVVAWLVGTQEVGVLELLVDELDAGVTVEGRRILDRPANRHRR
jgi:hypothetical protein